MDITLKEVDRSNFDEVIKLEVNESQRGFVASNIKSIAESKVYENLCTRAIYNEDELIGFLMYGQDDGKTDDVWIIRLMIDKSFQGKGYGRAAMCCVIEEMRERYKKDKIYLSFQPDNTMAQTLYENLGFINTGRIEHGECVYCLDVKNFQNQNQ